MCPPYQAHVIYDSIPKEAPTYSVFEVEEGKDEKHNELENVLRGGSRIYELNNGTKLH